MMKPTLNDTRCLSSILLVVAGLAVCATTPRADEWPGNAPHECDAAYADALTTWLVDVCEGAPTYTVPGLPAASSTLQPPPTRPFLLTLERDFLILGDLPVALTRELDADRAALLQRLEEDVAVYRRFAASGAVDVAELRGSLVVGISQDTPAELAAYTFRLLASIDVTTIYLLYRDDRAPRFQLPNPAYVEELDALIASVEEVAERQRVIGEWVRQAVGDCEPMNGVLSSLGLVSVEERCHHLARGLPAAHIACRCSRDLERVVTPWLWSEAAAPNLVVVRLNVDESGRRVSLPSEGSWGEFAPSLVELDGQSVWLQ